MSEPLAAARRRPTCACRGTGILNRRVIDGTEGYITCGFCGVESVGVKQPTDSASAHSGAPTTPPSASSLARDDAQ